MADISQEIEAFRSAIYGEEVRGSMISLCEKVNDESSNAEAQAISSQTSALNSANSASTSEANAKVSEVNASASEIEAKSWAVGGTGSRAGEDANNAKYWCEQASAQSGVGAGNLILKQKGEIAGTFNANATTDVEIDLDGGGIMPQLIIATESDCTVSVSNGTKSYTVTSTGAGLFSCEVDAFGTYIVTATNALGDATANVIVDACKIYTVNVSHFNANITVNYPTGATCTVTNGAETYTATASGQTITVHSTGSWTVSASYDAQTVSSKVVTVTTDGQALTVTIDEFADITITYGEDLVSANITLTKGSKTYSKVATSSGSVLFHVAEYGIWTASATVSGTEFSTEINANAKGAYTAELGGVAFDYQGWLDSAEITTSFTSLEEVLASEITVRTLMTKHASVDYLVEWLGEDDTLLTTIIASTNAMKWIGLRDYAYDSLYAYHSQFLASTNWEYILKDHVPTMTSNSAPYGEASCSQNISGYEAYKVFDQQSGTWWCTNDGQQGANNWVKYHFTNPIKVNRFALKTRYLAGNMLKTYKIQGSNDGSTWTDLFTETLENRDYTENIVHSFNNDNYYLEYRLLATDNSYYSSGIISFDTLQFYGRSLNVSVPTMTSNTSPFGECFGSTKLSDDYDYYKALDNSDSTMWHSVLGQGSNSYVGYDFKEDVRVKYAIIKPRANSYGTFLKSYKIQGYSTTWEDLASGTVTNSTSVQTIYVPFSNNKTYKKYRLLALDSYEADGNVAILELQFYGVSHSEYSNRHYIYDNGLQLETLDKYIADSTKASVDFESSQVHIKINGSEADLYTNAQIDLTSYNLIRAKFGSRFVKDITISMNSSKTSGSSSYPYVLATTSNGMLPNNASLDVSSLNQSYYLSLWERSDSYSFEADVKEWWLE